MVETRRNEKRARGAQKRRPRGRPLKFGRTARTVALTLPEDVLDWLRELDPDPGWAIVSLWEAATRSSAGPPPARPLAQLAHLPDGRALILVQQEPLLNLPAVETIPLADGRAFLALAPGKGIADLELAIVDHLESLPPDGPERAVLDAIRKEVRGWRTDSRLVIGSRTVLLVEPAGPGIRRRAPLTPLRTARAR